MTGRQLNAFVIVLALGTLAHEVVFLRHVSALDGASVWSYFEGYRLLTPSLPLDARVAGVLHVALVVCIGAMLLPWNRGLAAVLATPVVLSQILIYGMKPSNHYFVLCCAYVLFSAHYLLARLADRRAARVASDHDTDGQFLRLNVVLLLVSTYGFAALAKMNTDFLNPSESHAALFTWGLLAPVGYPLRLALGISPEALWMFYGAVGIVATFVFELGIPLFLVLHRWTRLAILMGLIFHLAILYNSAVDFSMICLALYVLALTPQEFDTIWSGYVLRPRWPGVAAMLLIVAYLCVAAFKRDLVASLGTWMAWYRIAHMAAVSYAMIAFGRFVFEAGLRRRSAVEAAPKLQVV